MKKIVKNSFLLLFVFQLIACGFNPVISSPPLIASDEIRESARLYGEPIPILIGVPGYPIRALERRIEGSVLVEFDVLSNGSTTNIRIVESTSSWFDSSARLTIQSSTFEPTDEIYINHSRRVLFELSE